VSRDGSVTFTWADGEHRFRLAIAQLRELQEKCDAGPAFILGRLQSGRWLIDDIRETLRLGLIGGGAKPADAVKLVQRYVDERPLLESVQPAMAVLLAALIGAEDEPLGKQVAAKAQGSSAESSASPPSTEPAPPSASAPAKSTP
jgi:hypothetical protein